MTNKGGRKAECADDQGNRCGKETCRSCKRHRQGIERKKREEERIRKQALAAAGVTPLQSAAPSTSASAAPGGEMGTDFPHPPETFSGPPPSAQNPIAANSNAGELHGERLPVLRSSIVHRTKPSVSFPPQAQLVIDSPIDWASFGPPDPEPEKTIEEEEEEARAEEMRQRIENPSPLALFAAGFVSQMLKSDMDYFAEHLPGIPGIESESNRQMISGAFRELAIPTFAKLLPDTELSEGTRDAIVLGTPAISRATRIFMERRAANDQAESREPQMPQEPPENMPPSPQPPIDIEPTQAEPVGESEEFDDDWDDQGEPLDDESIYGGAAL